MATTNNFMEALSKFIIESIPEEAKDIGFDLDKFTAQTYASSMGVVRDPFGDNWQVKMIFSTGLSGAEGWRDARGPAPLMADAAGTNYGSPTVFGSNVIQTWQSINTVTQPGFIEKTVTLVEGYGQFVIPHRLTQTDQMKASRARYIDLILRGAAKRRALADIHVAWKIDDTSLTGFLSPSNAIATIVGDGSALSTTAREFTVGAGRMRAFHRGLTLSIYGVDGTSFDNSATIVVERVNPLKNTVWLKTVSGSSTSLVSSTVYLVLPRDTKFRKDTGVAGTSLNLNATPSGICDWVRGSGSFYGIDLTYVPELRSTVDLTLSGVATGDIFNKYYTGHMEAGGTEYDTLVTTPGVMMSILKSIGTSQQLIRYEGQNQALQVKMGFLPLSYVYDGRMIRFMTSANCFRGNVFFMKLGGQNIKRYIPPTQKGAVSQENFGDAEFVAPMYGVRGIFMPAYVDSSLGDAMVAYYKHFREVCPEDPRSIRLGTFTENVYIG